MRIKRKGEEIIYAFYGSVSQGVSLKKWVRGKPIYDRDLNVSKSKINEILTYFKQKKSEKDNAWKTVEIERNRKERQSIQDDFKEETDYVEGKDYKVIK